MQRLRSRFSIHKDYCQDRVSSQEDSGYKDKNNGRRAAQVFVFFFSKCKMATIFIFNSWKIKNYNLRKSLSANLIQSYLLYMLVLNFFFYTTYTKLHHIIQILLTIWTNERTSYYPGQSIHIPKHASLISVLSVLWIIFTTKITASGVRNEIACERSEHKQKLEMHYSEFHRDGGSG